MEKRGAGHIEFILSVILFLGIVGFALFFFAPSGGNRTIESSLTYGFSEIIGDTEVEVDSYSVSINNLGTIGNDAIFVALSDITNKKSRVSDPDGSVVLESRVSSGGIDFKPSGESFVIIRTSEDIVENIELGAGSVVLNDPSLYEIASSSSSKIVSEFGIDNLKIAYEGNYNDVKNNRFNLAGVDFSFSLTFISDGKSIEPDVTIPEGLEVFSRLKRIEVLRRDGVLEFADLVVRIW